MASPTKRLQSHSRADKEGQNIQVFVRCRPLNESEKAQRSYSVVDTPNSREITVKEKQSSSLTKTFQFDKVFGIKSKQLDVYRSVVEPLIGQVMQGYNCTVFAYGQTGTGKTFTMEGGDGRDDPNLTWENDPTAGIIPRALAQLFDELRLQKEAEFSVRVSFLELYNEELFDLLSGESDLTKLRLYEDSARKGSVIIQGLEEVQVHSKKEVYDILEKGSKKRQTAATLMNAHSSRSHTVFTVTVHMKESSNGDGEEVLRIGKLNLVDLAGSENVGRSGAIDKRAREAGNINQSLLTLGRVITCLVERTPHIPYRESKLTRLLQDSLGGRTKTSIIATVSPAGINLEETLSTLDYAHRAKNITNKPEVNQKMSKKAVLKEYTEEIERLRKDLLASREKNGVFLDHDNYQGMLAKKEAVDQDLAEKLAAIKAMTEEMNKKEAEYDEVAAELEEKVAELESTSSKLSETERSLSCTRTVLHQTAMEKEEQAHLVGVHQETEVKLGEQARRLLEVADVSTKEGKLMHDKLDRLRNMEDENKMAKGEFNQAFAANVEEMVAAMESYGAGHARDCSSLGERLGGQLEERVAALSLLAGELGSLVGDQQGSVASLDSLRREISEGEKQFLASRRLDMEAAVEAAREREEVFHREDMRPVLSQVVDIVKLQAAELARLKESVCGDLEELVRTMEGFSRATVEGVTGLQRGVEEYARANEARIVTLQTKNSEIAASEANIAALLSTLMTSYASHSALVSGHTAAIQAGAEEDLGQVQGLVETAGRAAKQAEQMEAATLAKVQEENARVAGYVTEVSGQCQARNTEVLAKQEQLGAFARAHVEETKAGWAACQEEMAGKVTEHNKWAQEQQERFQGAVDSSRKQLEERSTAVKKGMEETRDKDEAAVLRLATEVEELGERCGETMGQLQTRLGEEKETVASFITEVLRVDQPTGHTPARTSRMFPHYLEATSPHERILNRYRANVESLTVAARLPLEDSDNDDSLVSASNPSLSRESSDGEIITKRKSPVEGVSRQNSQEKRPLKRSDSQSSSRSSSRQNSATDLRREPRGSVTSELGSSECGEQGQDQENRDPFRKPAAGGKRPTGIRKPRGHLGTQNS